MTPAPEIVLSIVIPCKDEAGNIGGLIDEVDAALGPFPPAHPYEVIVVDDGSSDGTGALVARMRGNRPWLRVLHHARCAGQSAGLRSGLLASRGKIVALLDGDGQNDPAYLPRLFEMLVQSGPDTGMVAGQRLRRTDSTAKRLASRFANGLRQWVLRDGARDTGNGLKALRREVWLALPYFDHWHRFLPALVVREGYRVRFVDVVDRPRRSGHSKYGLLDRALAGLLDLFGVWWLRRRRKVVPSVFEEGE